jgi:uncharacterized repeat protein (TIGR01451 family)
MHAIVGFRPRHVLLATILLAAHARSASAAPAGTLQKVANPVDGNGNGTFDLYERIEYTLTFTNSGTVDLTDVVVRDFSSACLRLDVGSVAIEPATGGRSWSTGEDIEVDLESPLPAGESVRITFTGQAMSEGSCCNQATWSSAQVPGGLSDRDTQDANADEPTCHVASAIPSNVYDAVVDEQVLTTGCLEPDGLVELRVRIQNTGRHPLLNARFEDQIDIDFANVVVDAGLTYDSDTNLIHADPRNYSVGEEVVYTFRAELPCTEGGELRNTARLTFEDSSGNQFMRSDTESVNWGRPDLWSSSMTWADDPSDGDDVVSPGEDVTFTIIVRNTGFCEALDLSVTDDLDTRLVDSAPTLVVHDGGVYSPATRSIEWTSATTPRLTALQPGSEVALSFTTRIEPGTAESFIPNMATIRLVGNDPGACTALPSLTRRIALQNGDVAFGQVVPAGIMVRNDYISCLDDAIRTIRGEGVPGMPPLLRERPAPQECSSPSAINDAHPETDVIVNPASPLTFVDDAAWHNPTCPQMPSGSGRMLVFYELVDDCTTSLRVRKDPDNTVDVVITW